MANTKLDALPLAELRRWIADEFKLPATPAAPEDTVAATTLGTVIAYQAVRDETGSIIGYLPVYDSIT